MKLEEYLKAIEECPDEFIEGKGWRLTQEFGVYDNYLILLNTNYDKLLDYLESNNYDKGKRYREYTVEEKARFGLAPDFDAKNYQFFYKPGSVMLQVRNHVPPGLCTDDEKEGKEQHYKRQVKEFNSGIILHPHSGKQIPNTNWIRALGLVILDIGQYAVKNSVPLCLPDSSGWSHHKDNSRIVYFDPKKEALEK